MSAKLLVSHWALEPGLLSAAAAYAGLYAWGIHRARRRWPAWRTLSFLAGLGVVILATSSGIGTYDERLLSVHMVQHMVLLMLAPLLLLGGRPLGLALSALPTNAARRLAARLRRLSRWMNPAVCLIVPGLVLLLTHLPAFYEATLRDPALHAAEHGVLLLSGVLLWWPLLDADPAPTRRVGGLGRLIYVLAAMVPMAVLGAYLNRHLSLLYPAYAGPARALHRSALVDQAQAGAIMWVAGSTMMLAVGLWAVIGALVSEERRLAAREALG